MLRDAALEAAIIEAPNDPAPRMVYGDWLAAQGDPRGPWFALSAAVEAAPLDVRLRSAATELFNTEGALFLGDGVALRPGSTYGWVGGFLDEIRLQPFPTLDRGQAVAAAGALFNHPHARFLRHLALGNLPELDEVLGELHAAKLPLLETLTVVDGDSAVGVYELDELVGELRALGARNATWSVPAPRLRELWIELNSDQEAGFAQIALAPNLEELTLDCRYELPSPDELATLWKLPRLRVLRVMHHRDPPALINALTPPPPGLRLFDVSHSPADAAAVAPIASWPKHCALVAVRTNLIADAAPAVCKDRRFTASTPALDGWSSLRHDTGGDTWWVHRAKTDGRAALRTVANVGRALVDTAIRYNDSSKFDLEIMDMCLTFPSEQWRVWPWALAAGARSWKYQYALCELIAREGLMREPLEPNFYAFVLRLT